MSDTGSMTTTDYLMNIALIALVILQIRGHKVTRARLVFPLVATVFVAAQFLHAVPTAGNDLVLIIGFSCVGAALGAGAGLLTSVRRDGASAFAKAGLVAAVLWVLGIGARMGFALWVGHGGQSAVARFSVLHHITSGTAWGAAFVLMAMAEVASRTGVLYLKTRRTGAVIERGRPPPVPGRGLILEARRSIVGVGSSSPWGCASQLRAQLGTRTERMLSAGRLAALGGLLWSRRTSRHRKV